MGSFFSGTDNNDDRGGIRFSGVFGQLQNATPSTVWRFNYMDKKFEAKVEDIFEAPPVEAAEVPKEWLSRVVVSAPVTAQTLQPTRRGNGKSRVVKEYSLGNPKGKGGALADRHNFYDESDFQGDFWGFGSNGTGDSLSRMIDSQQHLLYGRDAADQAERRMAWESMLSGVEERSAPEYREVRRQYIAGDEEVSVPVGANGVYEDMQVLYGVEIADAYDSIDHEMTALEGQDELLGTLASDMIGLIMDDAVKLDLLRAAYGTLGPDGREKLATTGF